MNRRAFVTGLGAVLAAPLAAVAQQTRIYRIGVVHQGGPYVDAVHGLVDGLRELGLEERKHFIIDVRDTKGDLKLVDAAARALEQQKIDVIYSVATSVTLAVRRATKTVPIVSYGGTDPVAVGLVESFRKPGGRVTGVYGRFTDLTAKRLELLKEMVPNLGRVEIFYNPDNPAARLSLEIARDAARRLNLKLIEEPVGSVEKLRAALQALDARTVNAFIYASDAMVVSHEELIIEASKARRLPTMLAYQGSVAKGALASYGESYFALGRLAAKQVQRVLLGANPGDLPIEQLDRPHFVINLKTAKALGLTIPPSLLLRADQVIE